MNRYL